MEIKELLEKYGRAQLGIDGDHGFALLGEDLQEGESEFVKIPFIIPDNSTHHERYTRESIQEQELKAKLWACKKALDNLRKRINAPDMNFYFGNSHPYGN